MNKDDIINHLFTLSDMKRKEKMKRFGIDISTSLGIPVYELRAFARKIGKNHALALELWETKIHEAQMLAALMDNPKEVTEEQMERWALDFNSWDLCDHCCYNLFDKTPFAYKKINEWSTRKEEFVKRAAFALIAALSVHDKKADDQTFERFFPIIEKQCTDERTYVKKAVSWALRGIGKRNKHLNMQAIVHAKAIHQLDSSSAKYIASETLRELQSEKIQQRIKRKSN